MGFGGAGENAFPLLATPELRCEEPFEPVPVTHSASQRKREEREAREKREEGRERARAREIERGRETGSSQTVFQSCSPAVRQSARNVERFRGELVFKAHRLLYHSTLGLRGIKKKKSASQTVVKSEHAS